MMEISRLTDSKPWSDNRGFTLIEMAIVLIIIGIIIGAVVKGKDLIRGSEQKKIYSQFLSEWRTSYLHFYDRTGRVLGDTDNDGRADTNPNQRGNPPTDKGRDALVAGDTVRKPPTYYGLAQVGLQSPKTNTDKAWKYRYSDSKGRAHELVLSFDFDETQKYNYLKVDDIPNELCIAIDALVDGKADGSAGDFIADAVAGAAWGATPTDTSSARWKMQF